MMVKMVPKVPSAVSLKLNSWRTGSPSAPSNCRSKKFNRLMANSRNRAYLAPVAALAMTPSAGPAGAPPSIDCGLTDIASNPPENRCRPLVCRTSQRNAYILAQRPARRRHVFPERANLAARIVLQLRRRTEDHRCACLGIEGRPRRYARIIRIPSLRECDPTRGELVGHACRVVAVARLAERAGHVESVHGAIAAAKGGRGPFPLIHVNGALALRGLQFSLLDGGAAEARVGE